MTVWDPCGGGRRPSLCTMEIMLFSARPTIKFVSTPLRSKKEGVPCQEGSLYAICLVRETHIVTEGLAAVVPVDGTDIHGISAQTAHAICQKGMPSCDGQGLQVLMVVVACEESIPVLTAITSRNTIIVNHVVRGALLYWGPIEPSRC